MTATGSGPARARHESGGAVGARHDKAEYDELLRLLPPPPARDLAADRHSHHKDRLMQLIDQDQHTAPAPQHEPAPRRRLLRPALWMPLAATALAGTLAVTLTTHTGTGTADTPRGNTAVVLLEQVADVAAKSEATPVRDDQLVYVKSLTAAAEGRPDGSFEPGKPHQREVWMSQSAAPAKTVGLIHENGDYFPISELVPPGSKGVPAGIDRPTYNWLASLPTDPDVLLERLYALTEPADGQEEAQAVFDTIGELLAETVMPPRNAAALYRAAAKIPGVTRDADAVDSAGRHGFGIRRVDERASTATEWVFDREDLTYLGERSYLTEDGDAGAKGTVLEETAVLERAVVDAYRERPGSASGTE
ncbi:CU044_5270 family protein [Streptomyces sp. TRM S81-3]|uniref:CU044_5270 family protein n=1 Tax=Streptomyces griseicoloratus TaxID=2752516 RepID=A0A926L9S5_9ACTN|nr:CU044_5270 family protein [Streptomyces griseicoloratus]MBD0424655.1 CU044_5270 family protein [Streptomyces griseicoloratus]